MLKYLSRALSALTPQTGYDRERAGRRSFYKQEQARINAKRAQLHEAAAGGDRKANTLLRQLAQAGAAGGNTEREQRHAALERADAELHETTDRNLARLRAEVASHQAELAALDRRTWIFAKAADEAKCVELFNTKGKSDEAIEFLRQLKADGLVIETELP